MISTARIFASRDRCGFTDPACALGSDLTAEVEAMVVELVTVHLARAGLGASSGLAVLATNIGTVQRRRGQCDLALASFHDALAQSRSGADRLGAGPAAWRTDHR